MSRLSFRYQINGVMYQFTGEAPYKPGHRLTHSEAEALNRLRIERIQDRLRKQFIQFCKEREQVSVILTEEDVANFQQQIDLFGESYRFGGNHNIEGSLERELRLLCEEKAIAEGIEGEEEIEERVLQLIAEPGLLAIEARERVKARAELAAKAVEELIS